MSLLAGQGSALVMISACALAGELCAAERRYQHAFARYEALLRSYIGAMQRGAERFATAFAPKTRVGMCFRDLVIKAFAIPYSARLVVGGDIADVLQLLSYGWPSLDQVTAA
jgi:2-polyprenyl-6-methoxyphenol hydroxylase-like FAD-dependent oxidoreductase